MGTGKITSTKLTAIKPNRNEIYSSPVYTICDIKLIITEFLLTDVELKKFMTSFDIHVFTY